MKIFVSTLYRFGYDLTVVTKSEQAGRDALSAEYKRAYMTLNKLDSVENMEADEEFQDLYATAMECIETREYEIGKVEWE